MTGLRVIGGAAKGRKLKPVPGEGTRPVMDRVKEALFNILADDIEEATFLDLFAGTGGVGIEALSRGAAQATFVEKGGPAAHVIQDNLNHTGLAAYGRVVRSDVFIFLRNAPRAGFDFVYIAPPQYHGLWLDTLKALDARPSWVNPDGAAIVQIDPKEFVAVALEHFTLVDQRKYGGTLLCFYEHTSETPPAPTLPAA